MARWTKVDEVARWTKWRGSVDRKLVEAPHPPPSNFIAGRPKGALLVWFFCGFRCDYVLLFLLDINIENR